MKKRKVFCLLSIFLIIIPSFSSAHDMILRNDGNYKRPTLNSLEDNNITLKTHVVIAVIDSGINVYHEAFRRPNLTVDPSSYIDGFPNDTAAVNLTFTGNYTSNYEADKYIWEEQLKTHTLYWFPHTNVIGISISQFLPTILIFKEYPIIDEFFHGTGVASIIAKQNPNATIVMIEAGADKLDEAFSWAVNQSWIDIITTEYAILYRPLILFSSLRQWADLPAITKRGYDEGKIIIVPSGNRPWVNPMFSPLSGPPWVICVGGAEPFCHGAALSATKNADYVSSFTQDAAFYESTTTYFSASGTSFSVPSVAGTISNIIFSIRKEVNYTHGIINNTLIFIPEQDVHITNKDIRNAINHTAVYWKTTAWSLRDWIEQSPYVNASDPYSGEPYTDFSMIFFRITSLTLPINPIAPWLQMGWGFVDNSIVNETVKVLLKKNAMPEKNSKAIQYMENRYTLRKQRWGE